MSNLTMTLPDVVAIAMAETLRNSEVETWIELAREVAETMIRSWPDAVKGTPPAGKDTCTLVLPAKYSYLILPMIEEETK